MGNEQITQDGPDWVMAHQVSGRRDFRVYLVLVFGLFFVWAGLAVDPASNCDGSGECAPWLVPVAFWIGVLASLAGVMGLMRNPKRGSRINARTGELEWWNEAHASLRGTLKLADVAMIRLDTASDTSTLKLFDAHDALLPFGGTEVVPWRLEKWARAVQQRYPHIRVVMAE